MKSLVVAAIAVISLSAAAEGNIGFGGEVQLVTSITLETSPVVGLALDDSNQFLAGFRENNNDPRGYKINVTSAGEFALVNSINSTVKIPYSLEYQRSGPDAPITGLLSDFSVIHAPTQGQPAEIVEDRISALRITLDSGAVSGSLHGGGYVDELTVTATHL